MTALALEWGLTAAHLMLAIAMGIGVWRMIRGPRAQDRILALDSFYLNGMLLILVFGIRTGQAVYFEAALIVAMVGFASTAALAKFLMRGEVIE